MLKLIVRSLVAAVVLLVPANALAAGEVSLTALDTPYSQNFDTLASSGTSSATPAGWAFAESLTNANGLYTAGTGSSNAGDTYSFGATASTERAFGGLQSGNLLPTIGAGFRNDTASIITSLDIAYTGEQWRLGTSGRAVPDRLDFEFSTTASDLTTGGWTAVDPLDFNGPVTVGAVGLLNGNLPANRAAVLSTIGGLTIFPGQTVWIRWNDFNATGSDDGLAVDDFNLTPHTSAVPENLSIADVSVAEGDTGTVNASFTVQLSRPAPAGGVTFDIATSDGTATAPSDYTARALTGVTIPEGQTSFSFPVAVNGDTLTEPDETFSVDVTNVSGATVTDGHAVGTIANDDVATSARIHDIQGAGHTSPLVGTTVTAVPGIVTQKISNGFFLQDPTPDADPATSEGIFVFGSQSAAKVVVGDSVLVTGPVSEFAGGSATNLTSTEISSTLSQLKVLTHGNALPAATAWNPPTETIEDDGLATFDPSQDGLDYAESLEGMRVSVAGAEATGPSIDFASSSTTEVSVVGPDAGIRTPRGGIVIRANDFNPERIILQTPIHGVSGVNVGAKISGPDGPVVGVIDYNFGNYKLRPEAPLTVSDNNLQPETTAAHTPQQLAIGTFNLENLAPDNPDSKFARLATTLVNNLKAPDIVALEEIQDNSGAADDGTVASDVTLNKLVDFIVAAGGPHYGWRYIAPENDKDGGQPGGNIRVAFLFNPDRVTFVDRGSAGTFDANDVVGTGADTHLLLSPGRIDPASSAWESSRKPLAAEFMFHNHKVFVIGNHFASKSGDDPLYGRNQPPNRDSEVKRHLQAQEVRDFVSKLLTADPQANVVVAGDLNDFQFSETVDTLKAIGLRALIETLPIEEQYTYDFDGNSQAIDHILTSPALTALVHDGDYDVVHVNSEFASQGSDHEPQVVRLFLNDKPKVDAGGPYTVAEGSSVPLAATGTDTESAATLTYAWDLDGDGTFETTGRTPTFSAAALDGPTTQDVKVRVTDDAGQTATATATVSVTNVKPTASLSAAPSSVPEGTAVALTASATDPAPADTITYAWTVTKNGAAYASGTGTAISYTPDDNGTYVVSVTATDDDGGADTATATTTATNVAPTASLSAAPASVPEGTAVSLTASSTDPGSADTVGYAWTVTKNGAAFASGTGTAISYTPNDDGTYVVTVTATDDDGGAGTATATTTATNVAPTATFNAPPQVFAGDDFTLSLTGGADASSVDAASLQYAFDCGSGAYSAFGSASTATCHADTVGDRTVHGQVRDKDGGVTTYTATVKVVVTPASLCSLTQRYVESSPKYQALPPAVKAATSQLVTALCQKLATIQPTWTPAQKAAVVAVYRAGVTALAQGGWLTPAQAATLRDLAGAL